MSLYLNIIDANGKLIYHNICADIYDDFKWFSQMTDLWHDDAIYSRLPIYEGYPFKDNGYRQDNKTCEEEYFINIEDFIKWYEKYNPDTKAGWFTTYDKWLYEEKGILPFYPQEHLAKDDVVADMHFVVYKEYSHFTWLYDFILVHEDITANCFFTYHIIDNLTD